MNQTCDLCFQNPVQSHSHKYTLTQQQSLWDGLIQSPTCITCMPEKIKRKREESALKGMNKEPQIIITTNPSNSIRVISIEKTISTQEPFPKKIKHHNETTSLTTEIIPTRIATIIEFPKEKESIRPKTTTPTSKVPTPTKPSIMEHNSSYKETDPLIITRELMRYKNLPEDMLRGYPYILADAEVITLPIRGSNKYKYIMTVLFEICLIVYEKGCVVNIFQRRMDVEGQINHIKQHKEVDWVTVEKIWNTTSYIAAKKISRKDLKRTLTTAISVTKMHKELRDWLKNYPKINIYAKGEGTETMVLNKLGVDDPVCLKQTLSIIEHQPGFIKVQELADYGIEKFPTDTPHIPLNELTTYFHEQIEKERNEINKRKG